jgi:DnaJ-class molecular chaperone
VSKHIPAEKILAIPNNSSPEHIQKAYNAFVMEYHPDKYTDPQDIQMATDVIAYINSQIR